MNPETHERARKLLGAATVEGISPMEDQWLKTHLSACEECTNEARALESAVGAFRSLRVVANGDMVRRTNLAVRRRAQELQARREHAIPLWISVGVSTVLVLVTTPYAWSLFAWFGRITNMPNMVWQAGFLMWWFLPATILAAAAGWKRVVEPQSEWRQL
jgi:hypothetical protein